jgi:glycosyltransferase involved in cell wall biosynthesis
MQSNERSPEVQAQMKIAQVSFRYYPYFGGVEEHARNISERLAKEHDVSVFTTDSSRKLPREETLNSVKIKRFDCWAPNGAYYFSPQLRKYLREVSGDFDIVHAHNYACFPALYAAQAKKQACLHAALPRCGAHFFQIATPQAIQTTREENFRQGRQDSLRFGIREKSDNHGFYIRSRKDGGHS